MNRLWFRLFLSFGLVTGLIIVLVAFLMSNAIETNFGNFLNTSNSVRFGSDFLDQLETFYSEKASWEDVDALFSTHQSTSGSGSGSNRQGGGQGGGQGAQIFISDITGDIVYATQPDWIGINMSDIGDHRSVELFQGNQLIGYLGEQTPGTIALNQAEAQFLQDTTNGLLLATLGSAIIAFTLAILLTRSLTQPLTNLAQHVGQMTTSDLGQVIHANGTLEIAQLSTAFNNLSLRLAEEQKRRQQMTADIAHELRTPLTVMRGHMEAMMDGIYPLDVQHIAVAYDQTLHLARLVEDMRLLTKAESGQLSLDKTVTQPGDLMIRAAQRFQPLAEDADVQLEVDVETHMPDLEIDVNRIQQALDNLISNALRHTNPGGTVMLSAKTDTAQAVILRVHNTGKPLTATELDMIFDRFWRADEARKRDAGGTGLGLAITKSIVELHQGHVVALSTGDGTAFEIRLPV